MNLISVQKVDIFPTQKSKRLRILSNNSIKEENDIYFFYHL